MATINEIFGIAKSGLSASRAQMTVAGQNVANAATPGYARQVLELSTAHHRSLGVQTGDPLAIRNPMVQNRLVQAMGRHALHQERVDLLSLAEPIFSDLDEAGLGGALAAFNDALQNATSNPGGVVEREAILETGAQLAETFASTRHQLEEVSNVAIEGARAVAGNINLLTEDVASLNRQIQLADASGYSSNELIAQRDARIAELGSLIGVKTLERPDGTVSLFTVGGRALVESRFANKIEITGFSGDPEHQIEFQLVKPSGAAIAVPGEIGGELGGMISAHNEVIAPSIARLDELAFKFVNSFNAVHEQGFGLNGGQGYSFFTFTNGDPAIPGDEQIGAASSIALHPDVDGMPDNVAATAVAANLPGGNDNLFDLLDVTTQANGMGDGMSFEEARVDLGISLGTAISRSQLAVDTEIATQQQLENILASETGVNIDEELITVTEANRAFEASGKVLATADEMMATLLNMVG